MSFDLYTPMALDMLVNSTPSVATFFIDTFFKKNIKTFSTETIMVDIKKGGRQLAPFVHPKIGNKVVKNKGYKTETYTPPLVAPSKVTEADQLLKRLAGENPFSGMTPAERAAIKLGEDFMELKEMITRRMEWMAATAIFTGQIPIIGDSLNEVIDFNFTNKEIITSATLKWSADTANPIEDLKKWRKKVQEKGYVNCDICIMSSDVVAAFINNKNVKELLDIKNYNIAKIEPKELPNGVTYVGTISFLGLSIYEYNEIYLDDWTDAEAPVEKYLVPSGTLALLSTSARYTLNFGAITLIDKNTEEFHTVMGDMVPQSWVDIGNATKWIKLSSKPLPVPNEVDSWFVAKVI